MCDSGKPLQVVVAFRANRGTTDVDLTIEVCYRLAGDVSTNAGPLRVVYRAGADPAVGRGVDGDLRIPNIVGGPAAVSDFG